MSIQAPLGASAVDSASTESHIGHGSTYSPYSSSSASGPITEASPSASEPSAAEAGPDHASPSRSSSSSPTRASASTTIRRKRARPKIDLAPGQPPTARGNPRIRVFVACYQCRSRKIRCDGAKPICHNCQKRPSGAEQCRYDSGPNRRGPEKVISRAPGSNQGLVGRKLPMRTPSPLVEDHGQSLLSGSGSAPDSGGSHASPSVPTLDEFTVASELLDFSDEMIWQFDPLWQDVGPIASTSQVLEQSIVVPLPQRSDEDQEQEGTLPSRPGSQFTRDTWWDALLTYYATERESGLEGMQAVSLSPSQRSNVMKAIMSDIKAVLQSSPSWLSFLNLPRFFDTLFNPIRRQSLQPSLLFSVLALGALAQSSEVEKGARGRQNALRLLEMAHGALEGALATGWVDIGLAQAAFCIFYFELQSHPKQCLERSRSALFLLDSLFRLFNLPCVDEALKSRGQTPHDILRSTARHDYFNPAVQMGFTPSPRFTPVQGGSSFPVDITRAASVPLLSSSIFNYHTSPPPSTHMHRPHGCKCVQLSLGHTWPAIKTLAPAWSASLMWPEGMSDGDFKKEECRRLVWSSIVIIANYHAYMNANPEMLLDTSHMFVREPEGFALMLPGETLAAMGVEVETDDIWTLRMRTTLLMQICMYIRGNRQLSLADRAQLAVQAWLEIDDIEARLERHTCDLDSAFGFQANEMLFGMRMLTSYEFQNFVPQITTKGSTLFYRDKAESWLQYVERAGDLVWESVSIATQSPNQDHRKSVLIFWFLTNIRRALQIWKTDPELISALMLSRRQAERVEYLMMFWPNMRLRVVWTKYRMELVQACLSAGIPPPSTALPRIPLP